MPHWLRHPVQAAAMRHYFRGLSGAALDRAMRTPVYVSRKTEWELPDCGAGELRTAARWARRASKLAARGRRQGPARDVRALRHERAAELLERWANCAGKKRIRDLSLWRQYAIYREAYDWQTGGLS